MDLLAWLVFFRHVYKYHVIVVNNSVRTSFTYAYSVIIIFTGTYNTSWLEHKHFTELIDKLDKTRVPRIRKSFTKWRLAI